MPQVNKEDISAVFKNIQDHICKELERVDGQGKFIEDKWQRPGGGGGRSRVIRAGNIIEKGGVNFSEVHGKTPEKILSSFGLTEGDFFATGVSIVLHPENPWVPIIHMNIRYFEMSNGTYWFGGGIDLTPHYVDTDDARTFHQKLKAVCDKHDTDYYKEFKPWADNYFYIKHRKETRGIGGIFFDHLSEDKNKSKEDIFNFVKDVGLIFAPIYTHFMTKNSVKTYGKREKDWQMNRRGRYVEFNLVLDRGTKFGLETDGRTESILMSLPPMAGWEYNYQPTANSLEAKTLSMLKKGINWVE
ncbi:MULTISPECIES: oxygen-dependent coproporphyrinogen oxidase [Roseivirga]|jgi:coproporphyrinogen III oxidase|uniref:coproporphyrinogen oxidase n=1 Tax=Roseivirga spongicola TaxID=333140 RepID=A0A150XBK8_9BACT|nr:MULTISPECIES: oxygen-dependent coproporphyrinogen oxidase [Roseivirga]PWL28371.1 MAG: oxygen-dependent coproporphyrinogen oxidase [Roseivirga sp. XM-24bin3]KYG76129.1 coproporphyrinogen III oxidase [Roseivirga spongicola]MBO6494348.1 oxygen-dependent coproporphyrinogen oxidase [Roseivirga sp.]MBO6659322.1 oxygen-dependent coproporphyrinogen oxidase [Roseivirga sp.]MBO6907941.1 oxygen-dependent coproporphyrinogen oxidase [Roseivirga sp.]